MKETDTEKEIKKIPEKQSDNFRYPRTLENLNNRKLNLLSTRDLDQAIKNLSNPRFLGSIHLKRDASPSNMIDDMLKGELGIKLNKSLKNTLFNPITKLLILLMIVFNLMWLIFVLFG